MQYSMVHTEMTGGFASLTMSDFVELHEGIIVSPEDADIRVCRLGKEKYAYTTSKGIKTNIHQIIMRRMLMVELPKHLVVDHINNNRLDNRRSNLQLVTMRVNTTKRKSETSNYYRITYNKRFDYYYVRMSTGDSPKAEHFGMYKDELEAAFWSDVWAYRMFPVEETILNFPERIEEIHQAALKLDNKHIPWRRDTNAIVYAPSIIP